MTVLRGDRTIATGFFVDRARRSARWALVRNGVLGLAVLGLHVVGLVAVLSDGFQPAFLGSVAVAWSLIGLFGWRAAVAHRRLRDPSKHPILADFAPYGDPLALATETERAVQAGDACVIGDAILGPRFLVAVGLGHDVVAIDEIVWVYPKSTRYRLSLVIPLGTVETICLVGARPEHRHFPIEILATGELYAALVRATPRARHGWTAALADAHRRDPAAFARSVRGA